jgi:hypothetical protein
VEDVASYPQRATEIGIFTTAGTGKTQGSSRNRYWPSLAPGRWKLTPRSSLTLVVAGRSRRKVPQCLPYDGVILDFLFVLIAEDQHCGGSRICLFRSGRRRRTARVNIGIALLAHSLLLKALGVHFVGQADLVLLTLIVGGAGIPPPIGINSVAQPRIAKAATATETIISEAEGADSKVV